jgi:choline dehydrogenase-like flavoprotein
MASQLWSAQAVPLVSRGRVLLRGNDPTAHPRIFPEYFSESEDLQGLARSVRRMRDMMRGQSIRDLIEVGPDARSNR